MLKEPAVCITRLVGGSLVSTNLAGRLRDWLLSKIVHKTRERRLHTAEMQFWWMLRSVQFDSTGIYDQNVTFCVMPFGMRNVP
jgi:hypothetical protein